MCGKYYVYELAKPDGHVFYVGKGSGNRIDNHERDARSTNPVLSNQRKLKVIREVEARGEKILKNKVVDCISSEALAYAIEYERMNIYGYKNLTNSSEGTGRGKFLLKQITGKTRKAYD